MIARRGYTPMLLVLACLPAAAAPPGPTKPSIRQLPIPAVARPAFIENRGQFDPAVRYQLKAQTGTLWVTEKGLVFDVANGSEPEITRPSNLKGDGPTAVKRYVFAADFLDADLSNFEPSEPEPGVYNYLTTDPAKSRTGVRAYKTIVAHDIWPGIDLRLFLNGSGIEQEFILRAGADPDHIRISYRGADTLKTTDSGGLVVTTPAGQLSESKPYVYQDIDGNRVQVAGRFKLTGSAAYGFALAGYDTTYSIVLDPTLLFSTYLGGSGADRGNGVAVDSSGNVYVAGQTTSSNFPITVGQTAATVSAAFITKLNPTGTALVYSTYIQSSTPWWDPYWAQAIAVDHSGSAYIAGWASVQNDPYPTTPNRFQGCGGYEGTYLFITKLNSTGDSMLYSSCLGGDYYGYTTYLSHKLGIAADDNGNAYLVGGNSTCDLPTTDNAFQRTCIGQADAFLAKFDTNAAGAASLTYSSYFGGTLHDIGTAVALDSSGKVYMAGWSRSGDFPTTPGAYQTSSLDARYGGFVAKFDLSLSGAASLVYSSRLSSSGSYGVDSIYALAVDQTGAAYVAGRTSAYTFPTTPGAFQATNLAGEDTGFVSKFTSSGAALVYSTYLGGGGYGGEVNALAVDSSGNAYVTGWTRSPTFPVKDAVQPSFGGGTCGSYLCMDAFVTELNPQGSALVYSTYLGGNLDDQGFGIALDSYGNATVTGATASPVFPTTRIPFQPALGGSSNAFVSQLGPGRPVAGPTILKVWPSRGGNAGSATIAFVGGGFAAGATVSLTCPSQAPIPASNILVSADGGYMTATFNLVGVAAQKCDIVLRNPDGTSFTLGAAFTIEPGGGPDIWADILGRSVIRGGMNQTYYIVVGNRGNIDADSASVWLRFPSILSWNAPVAQQPSNVRQVGSDTVLFYDLMGTIPVGSITPFVVQLTAPDQTQYAHQTFTVEVSSNAR